MVLFIAIWFYFLRHSMGPDSHAGQQRAYWERSEQHMERLETLLEQIVTALNKRK
jgi:hypothetical protein